MDQKNLKWLSFKWSTFSSLYMGQPGCRSEPTSNVSANKIVLVHRPLCLTKQYITDSFRLYVSTQLAQVFKRLSKIQPRRNIFVKKFDLWNLILILPYLASLSQSLCPMGIFSYSKIFLSISYWIPFAAVNTYILQATLFSSSDLLEEESPQSFLSAQYPKLN